MKHKEKQYQFMKNFMFLKEIICQKRDFSIILLSGILAIVFFNQQVAVAYTLPSGSPLIPTAVVGPQKLKVITIQFPDVPHDPNFDVTKSLTLLNEHYKANSYGKMSWEFDVYNNWYTMPHELSYYTKDLTNTDNPIIQDAFNAASRDVVFSKDDRVMFVYATPRSATIPPSNYPNGFMIWAFPNLPYPKDGSIRLSYTFAPDVWPAGNIPLFFIGHELGHLLGMPDLYGMGKASPWDIMAGDSSDSEAGLVFSSWSKIKLGWLDEKNIRTVAKGEKAIVTVDPLGVIPTGISAVKIPISDKKYFLIEVREQAGYEKILPRPNSAELPQHYNSPGVFVMQINEDLISTGEIVKWINPLTQQPGDDKIEITSSAFLVGESYSNPDVGKLTVKSKIGRSYEIEIDRTTILVEKPKYFTIETDKAHYSSKDSIAISGVVPSYDGGPVYIFLSTPESADVKFLSSADVNEKTREFSYSFKLKDMPVYGQYTLRADYDQFRVYTNFDLVDIPSSLIIKTDKLAYIKGDIVKITGTIPEYIKDEPIIINVIDPFSSEFFSKEVKPNDDKKFSLELKLDKSSPKEGIYFVRANYRQQVAENSFKFNTDSFKKLIAPKMFPNEGLGLSLTNGYVGIRYSTNETPFIVTIEPIVINIKKNTPVLVKITNPDDTIQELKIPLDIITRTFKTSLKCDSYSTMGIYFVEGTYGSLELEPVMFTVEKRGDKQDVIKSRIIQSSEIDEKNLVEENKPLPSWIKRNAGWWSQGTIGDADFTLGIEYMVKEEIIKIPNLSKQASGVGETKIPNWIKNNAGWWSKGQISDDDFVKAIKYLIEKGIIKIGS